MSMLRAGLIVAFVWLLAGSLFGCPRSIPPCSSDKDCPAGGFCHPEIKICFPIRCDGGMPVDDRPYCQSDGGVDAGVDAGEDGGVDAGSGCRRNEDCGPGRCVNGRCECDAGFHVCGGRCVSDFSVETCGSRCEPCPAVQYGRVGCDAGACTYECERGYFRCSTGCCAATQVAAGNSFTCAVLTSGEAKCWGANSRGNLGDGTTTARSAPAFVKLDKGVKAIAAGANHACAVTVDSALKCWGWNDVGQLGDGTATDRHLPVEVYGLSSGAVAVSAGTQHTCAVDAVGAVRCWGANASGELGDGTMNAKSTPVVPLGMGSGATAVAAGNAFSCAVHNGAAKCWGIGNLGQVGDGAGANRSYPVQVSGLGTGVRSVTAGLAHACAVIDGGALKCWGFNGEGALGNGNTNDSYVPVDVFGLAAGIKHVHSHYGHTCAVMDSAALKCWGANYAAQVGDGTTMNRSTPFDVPVPFAVDVSAGYRHSCAISNGRVLCWGQNIWGELGDGTTLSRATPAPIVDP